MAEIDFGDRQDATLLDDAVAAVLSEEAPPGPPSRVAVHLAETWRPTASETRRPLVRTRSASLTLTALLVFACILLWEFPNGRSHIALADVAATFRKAGSIQFRIVHYVHTLSDAGKWRTVSCGECSFKSPGFRREISFDESGVPWKIMTRDDARGISLELRMTQREAVLTEEGPPTATELRQGLSTSLEMLEDWLVNGQVRKELGTREIQGRQTVGLRVALADREADFWVDRATRQIVRFSEPPASVYDPENDPVAQNPIPPGATVNGQELKGWVWTDIIYDPPLDDAQYVLVPPDDYKVVRNRFREPAEKDLLEWLEIFAQVRGGTFADDENPPFSSANEVNLIERKSADERTAWDDTFLRGYVQKEEVSLKGSGRSVVVRFNLMHRDTWHYQGKGVRLGDGSTPICWFRPQGARTYRVVYGDLSVRDVSRDDLPRPR